MVSGFGIAMLLVGAQAGGGVDATDALVWNNDYGQAMVVAKREERMLLVEFHDDGVEQEEDVFVQALQSDAKLREFANRYVLARVGLSQKGSVAGRDVKLVHHGAFAELRGQPGLAIIDLRDPKSRHFGYAVSIYPFRLGANNKDNLAVLLDLPTGTLTQRTLIYAVRTNPERPASTEGLFLADLAEESEGHSNHQASIGLQGHHQWETRFHRINSRLPGGLLSQEVCAESWPGQGLIEAAIECVRSWRQSPGHWNAVRSRHRFFGYDMKRGRNGIWYATGIFAGRR